MTSREALEKRNDLPAVEFADVEEQAPEEDVHPAADLFRKFLVREDRVEVRRGNVLPIVDAVEVIEVAVEEIARGEVGRHGPFAAFERVKNVGRGRAVEFPVRAVVDAVAKGEDVPVHDQVGELPVLALRQVLGGRARVVAAVREVLPLVEMHLLVGHVVDEFLDGRDVFPGVRVVPVAVNGLVAKAEVLAKVLRVRLVEQVQQEVLKGRVVFGVDGREARDDVIVDVAVVRVRLHGRAAPRQVDHGVLRVEEHAEQILHRDLVRGRRVEHAAREHGVVDRRGARDVPADVGDGVDRFPADLEIGVDSLEGVDGRGLVPLARRVVVEIPATQHGLHLALEARFVHAFDGVAVPLHGDDGF